MDVKFGYNLLTKTIPLVLICSIIIIFLLRKAKNKYRPDTSMNFLNTPDMLQEERRKPERVEVNMDVVLDTSKGEVNANISNLSISGAFIKCDEKFPLKDTFKIILNSEDQQPLIVTAQITWSNQAIPGDRVVNRGMGVRFINNPQETRQALKTLLTKVSEAL
jgi:Tfp pilus assembly protein PilZ